MRKLEKKTSLDTHTHIEKNMKKKHQKPQTTRIHTLKRNMKKNTKNLTRHAYINWKKPQIGSRSTYLPAFHQLNAQALRRSRRSRPGHNPAIQSDHTQSGVDAKRRLRRDYVQRVRAAVYLVAHTQHVRAVHIAHCLGRGLSHARAFSGIHAGRSFFRGCSSRAGLHGGVAGGSK